MSMVETLYQVLTVPTPDALWALKRQLTMSSLPERACLLTTTEAFHHYLCDLQCKLSSRQFSELASLLDIGAVGGVAMQNLTSGEAQNWFKRFLLGTTSESLMVLASRQYIKGWESELRAIHEKADWFITDALWELSADTQPDIVPGERWEHIEKLLAPARNPDTPNMTKTVLLGRLFQALILGQMANLLPSGG